ncbi:Sulfate transporter [Minicystis rosea]|nr:Sulfate transporter [Minicystis rosea]
MGACTVLAAISVLLNATGLELATEQDLDLDRELRVTGVANVVLGLVGGVPGYLSLSESTLNHKVGAKSRAPGLIAGGLSLLALLAGPATLAYFPKPILGGLLLFMGLSFLLETVYDAWFRLPRLEYGLVILILVGHARARARGRGPSARSGGATPRLHGALRGACWIRDLQER